MKIKEETFHRFTKVKQALRSLIKTVRLPQTPVELSTCLFAKIGLGSMRLLRMPKKAPLFALGK